MWSATFLILLSAHIGTSIAPWQLFFQQSCGVHKGLLPKDIPASRRDQMLGVGGMVLVAIAVIVLGAVALSGLPDAKDLTTEAVLSALRQRLGETAMKLLALGLIEAGLIATIVITAGTGWAIGEALDLRRSLNASPGQAWRFYAPWVMDTFAVTAQSRTQEVQDVPIAMSIITAKQLDTIAATDLSHTNLFVPGLEVDGSDPTEPTYRIRGIGTNDHGIGTDSAVGIYVKGVYQNRTGGAMMALNDVARVEVLKGPQGTLFGRNNAGEYGKRYGDALLNVPVTKDLAIRMSVLDNQSDGYLKEAATGRHYGKDDEWGARMVARWQVTPDSTVPCPGTTTVSSSLRAWMWDSVPLSSTDLYQRAPFPADPSTYYDPRKAPFYNRP